MKNNQSKKVKTAVRIVLIALIGAFLGFQIYLLNAEKLVMTVDAVKKLEEVYA